jgi:hypothetical protein
VGCFSGVLSISRWLCLVSFCGCFWLGSFMGCFLDVLSVSRV